MSRKTRTVYSSKKLLAAKLKFPVRLVRLADNMTLAGVGEAQLANAVSLLFQCGNTAVVVSA